MKRHISRTNIEARIGDNTGRSNKFILGVSLDFFFAVGNI